MVVNRSPTEEENSMPLVDLTPPDPSKEIPPLYHTIRRGDTQSSHHRVAESPSSKRMTRESEMMDEPLSATSTIGRAL